MLYTVGTGQADLGQADRRCAQPDALKSSNRVAPGQRCVPCSLGSGQGSEAIGRCHQDDTEAVGESPLRPAVLQLCACLLQDCSGKWWCPRRLAATGGGGDLVACV